MAFENKDGLLVSFFCDDLIAELEEDIDEFGGHMLVDVIVQQSHGVTIYKDYFPCVPGEPLEREKIELSEGDLRSCTSFDEIRRSKTEYFFVQHFPHQECYNSVNTEQNCQKLIRNSARFRYRILAIFCG